MKKKLQELNNARFGSLGELIVEKYYPSPLKRKHHDRADFIDLKGNDIDVKSRRLLDREYIRPGTFNAKKMDNIDYVLVEFFKDQVVISKNKKIITVLGYNVISKIYNHWISNKSSQDVLTHKRDKKEWDSIKKRIKLHFDSIGFHSRILFRTVQSIFGNEAPHNLIPGKIKKNWVTVFINFKTYKIANKNIREVIAFLDEDSISFKRLLKPRLGKVKIDIEKMDKRYKFKDIDDLLKNWPKI